MASPRLDSHASAAPPSTPWGRRRLFRAAFCALALIASAVQADRLDLAREFATAGNYPEAIRACIQHLESNPSDVRGWTALGEYRLRGGDAQMALNDLERAVEIDPRDIPAQKTLARVVDQRGPQERALIEWRRLSQISSGAGKDSAEARIAAILARMEAKPAAGSAEIAAKPEAKLPAAPRTPADSLFEMAAAAYRKGDRDGTLALLRQALARNKSHAGAYLLAGIVRFERQEYDKAAFNLRRGRPDPQNGIDAVYYLARIDEAAGRRAAAQTAYADYLRLGSTRGHAADARARLATLSATPKSAPAAVAKPATPGHAPSPADTSHLATPVAGNPAKMAAPGVPLRFVRPSVALAVIEPSTPAGQMLAVAADHFEHHRPELALETYREAALRYPGTRAAALAPLNAAVVHFEVDSVEKASNQAEVFLRDNAVHELRPMARFVQALVHIRRNRPDEAIKILSALPPRKGGLPPLETDRLWVLAEAQSSAGQKGDAASTLRQAVAIERDVSRRRTLALRAAHEYQAVGAPGQALPILTDVRRGCDTSRVCENLAMSEADLRFQSGQHPQALAQYREIERKFPAGSGLDWALYQQGVALLALGKSDSAAAAWKRTVEQFPSSYWGEQAKLRHEDLLWRKRYRAMLK